MKIRTERVIDDSDWDKLVQDTYGKIYCFQQQDDCRDRGSVRFTVPDERWDYDAEMNDEIPEVVNHKTMGVKFEKWLARDIKEPLKESEYKEEKYDWEITMWWERNFYPALQAVANDLHKKGLLEAGEYTIDIDW